MTADKGQRRGAWIWQAGGAAIVDHSGKVRNIVLLGAHTLDDEDSIERTVPVLQSVRRRMELFQPSDFAESGADLLSRIDESIMRWRKLDAIRAGKMSEKPPAKIRRKWPKKS